CSFFKVLCVTSFLSFLEATFIIILGFYVVCNYFNVDLTRFLKYTAYYLLFSLFSAIFTSFFSVFINSTKNTSFGIFRSLCHYILIKIIL
ncbi:MAG TPA: hypothetical protein DD391_09685, partial [Clostridiales bacterium]|nr:hypothetical protein [Clostridiales bacterium]